MEQILQLLLLESLFILLASRIVSGEKYSSNSSITAMSGKGYQGGVCLEGTWAHVPL